MTIINSANNATVGFSSNSKAPRLAGPAKLFRLKNGAVKAMFTLIYETDGKNPVARRLPLEHIISPAKGQTLAGMGPYAHLTTGSPVVVRYEAYQDEPYTNDAGKTVYPPVTAKVTEISFAESSAAGKERIAKHGRSVITELDGSVTDGNGNAVEQSPAAPALA